MGHYAQQWVDKYVTSVAQVKGDLSWGPCYGSMGFDRGSSHTFFQAVGPKVVERHREALTWLQQYFKFEWGEDGDIRPLIEQGRNSLTGQQYKDAHFFWVAFHDDDFTCKTHRLLFLTLARACQEHPSATMAWDMATGLPGLLQSHATTKKNPVYEFVFVYEPGDGHSPVSSYDKNNKDWPTMETLLYKFHTGYTGGIQQLTGKLLKGAAQ